MLFQYNGEPPFVLHDCKNDKQCILRLDEKTILNAVFRGFPNIDLSHPMSKS